MLPVTLTLATAIALVSGGILACFAGYALFRVVLGVYGFIAGALAAASATGGGFTAALAGLAGGLVGAAIMVFAYFLGIAIVGAAAGMLVADLIWRSIASAPHTVVVLIFAVLGAAAALAVQRVAIVIATALVGAWTAVLGALALFNAPAEGGAGALVYPPASAPAGDWLLLVWLLLSAAGVAVQLARTRQKSI